MPDVTAGEGEQRAAEFVQRRIRGIIARFKIE